MKKTKTLRVRLDGKLHSILARRAYHAGRTKSSIAREILRASLMEK